MKYIFICFILILFAYKSIGKEIGKTSTITGKVTISTLKGTIAADLNYNIIVSDTAVRKVNIFLTPQAIISSVKGANVKSFRLDTNAKPFSTLIVELKRPAFPGEFITFNLVYTAKPKKGFWIEKYGWVDIDPDFMILPVFADFKYFNYELDASVDDDQYAMYDLDNARVSKSIHVSSLIPSYYFNPLQAGNAKQNGLRNYRFKKSGKEVNIMTTRPDSAVFCGDGALKILEMYNNTFGKTSQHNKITVLYRPIPYDELRITRSSFPSIVFALPHADLKVLSHEIAHFWWNRGDALTTEKWLSESFAEYAKLMFIRNTEGEEKFNAIIKDMESKSQGVPPMLGGDRFGKFGDDIIYIKGPYLLSILEQQIGRDKFAKLLTALNENNVSTTPQFLTELGQITSLKVSKNFEMMLNN